MRIIGYIFVVLVAIVVILPAFLSSTFQISRSVEVQATPEAVFANLSDLNKYKKWNPFAQGEANALIEVSGLGEGSYLKWKGEKMGEGKMTLTKVEPSQRIDIRLDFIEPMPGEAMAVWLIEPLESNRTRFTWTYMQENTYFKRLFGLVMGPMMGGLFDNGLKQFKIIMESSHHS